MAVQLINIGQIANDGTGDDLREAFFKVNQNFEELDLRDDEQTTVSNLGTIGEGLFANKINYDLQFKKIAAGDFISLAVDNEKIVISGTGVSSVYIAGDTGSATLENAAIFNIRGGSGITTNVVDNVLTIENTRLSEIVEDTTPQLGGNLDAQAYNITNVNSINAGSFNGSFIGNLTGLVNGYNPAIAGAYFEDQAWDFSDIIYSPTNIIEWLISSTDVDMGSIVNPDSRIIDNGTFV